MYEKLSMMMGLKNYNVALSKQVQFYDLFVKHLSPYINSFYAGANLINHTKYDLDYVPTGITELDLDLRGGLYRRQITTVLAGTNVGKSLFLKSIAAQAIENNPNLKVLHINLEGMKIESALRYTAIFSDSSYKDVLANFEELTANPKMTQVQKQLIIKNMMGFGVTIEEIEELLSEIKQNFDFDLLIIDGPQLLDSREKTLSFRQTIGLIFRKLHSFAMTYNCAVLIPAQATRSSQENKSPILRSSDITEAFEIARVSGVILTLNRLQTESNGNKLVVYLEKQRMGIKNKAYGIIVNYTAGKLITDKTFNPSLLI